MPRRRIEQIAQMQSVINPQSNSSQHDKPFVTGSKSTISSYVGSANVGK
jgi:hypothetical protein